MSYAVSKSTQGYSRKAGHRWRSDDLAQLRRLVRAGKPLKEMSLKLGRPVPAIRSKAQSIGLHLDNDQRQDIQSSARKGGIRSLRQPDRPPVSSTPPAECQLELF